MSENTNPDVIVVDDDSTLLEAVRRSVESVGLSVLALNDPRQCLQMLRKVKCGLLISDVNMPNMNGLELVKRVRSIRPQLPIVLMTGFADVPLAVRAIKAGAREFVEKPLDEDTFLPLIKSCYDPEFIKSDTAQTNLTASELEVLRLVAQGKCNKEIAYILDKSIRTIENQRQHLSKKLKSNSTADLVKAAMRLGLTSV